MLITLRSAICGVLMPLTAMLTGTLCAPSLLNRIWALRVAQWWGGFALWQLKVICGLGFTVKGRDNLPTGPALLAAKHQSMWETIALARLLPKPCFVLKKELLNIPFFGWWCRAAGFIAIDRAAGAGAMRDMIDKAKARLDEGYQLVIFPEGTRTAPGSEARYHPGVAGLYRTLDVPCVPVAHNSGCYFHHPGIRREPGAITVSFLEPIEPGLKRPAFMETLRERIEPEARALAGIAPAQNRDASPPVSSGGTN